MRHQRPSSAKRGALSFHAAGSSAGGGFWPEFPVAQAPSSATQRRARRLIALPSFRARRARKEGRAMRRLALLCVALLGACATGNSGQKPPPAELPAAWKESAPRFAEDGRWWRIYDDAVLDSLV